MTHASAISALILADTHGGTKSLLGPGRLQGAVNLVDGSSHASSWPRDEALHLESRRQGWRAGQSLLILLQLFHFGPQPMPSSPCLSLSPSLLPNYLPLTRFAFFALTSLSSACPACCCQARGTASRQSRGSRQRFLVLTTLSCQSPVGSLLTSPSFFFYFLFLLISFSSGSSFVFPLI